MASYGVWQGAERATGTMAATGMRLLEMRGTEQHRRALEADSARRLTMAEDQAKIQNAQQNLALEESIKKKAAYEKPLNINIHPYYLSMSDEGKKNWTEYLLANGAIDKGGVGQVGAIMDALGTVEKSKELFPKLMGSEVTAKQNAATAAWGQYQEAQASGDPKKAQTAKALFDQAYTAADTSLTAFKSHMDTLIKADQAKELERIKREGKGVPSQTEEQLTARALKGDKEAKAILDAMQQRKRDIAETREGGTRERADRQFAVTLRKEFNALPEVTEYNQTMPKIKSMQSAYEESKKSKNFVAIDQALITLYNKLTDPSSVVRESEYARTAENIPLINQIRGKAEKVLKGGAGLTGEERKALMDMAMLMQKGYEEIRSRRLNEYRGYGVQGGLTPEFLSDATGSMTAPKKVGRFVVEVE